jgi:hypothetical protein
MTKIIRVLLITALLTGTVGPAAAFEPSYDNNCKKLEETEELRAAEETANMSPILLIGFKLKQKSCKGVDFLRKVFAKQPDPDQIDADVVFEASKPEIDPVKVRQEYLKEEKKAAERIKMREERKRDEYLKSNPANDDAKERNERSDAEAMAARAREPLVPPLAREPEAVILPPAKQGGFIQIFQAHNGPAPAASADGQPPKPADIDGGGTLMSEDGIQRGTFKDSLLEGDGEEITAEGTWRGGNYQGGEIEGRGFEVGEKGGQAYIMEGNFVDDNPDGSVLVSYADGSSQRVLWDDGKAIAYGPTAAAGKIAAEPVYRSPQQLAAEADAEFERKLQSAASASVLFATADELAEKGDIAKARRAYRALMIRFPDSRLSALSAERLSNLDSRGVAVVAAKQAGSGPISPSVSQARPAIQTSPSAQYSSICTRDAAKFQEFLNQLISQFGSVPMTVRSQTEFMKSWNRCRSYDPESQQYYQNSLNGLNSMGNYNGQSNSAADDRMFAELTRMMTNPSYSAELGPIRKAQ